MKIHAWRAWPGSSIELRSGRPARLRAFQIGRRCWDGGQGFSMRLDHIAHLDEIPDRGWVSSNIWDRGLVSAVFVSSLTTAPPFRASSIKSRDPSSESASLREGRDTPICFANSRSDGQDGCRAFVVDAGFGSFASRVPIPPVDGAAAHGDCETYWIIRDGGRWMFCVPSSAAHSRTTPGSSSMAVSLDRLAQGDIIREAGSLTCAWFYRWPVSARRIPFYVQEANDRVIHPT